jgi:hypothetical protein
VSLLFTAPSIRHAARRGASVIGVIDDRLSKAFLASPGISSASTRRCRRAAAPIGNRWRVVDGANIGTHEMPRNSNAERVAPVTWANVNRQARAKGRAVSRSIDVAPQVDR